MGSVRRALWFDDQLVPSQERLLRRHIALLAREGVELVRAPNIATFARRLDEHWQEDTKTISVDLLVLDLMVPQMRGVRDFRDLGLESTRLDEYTCGIQLAEILFGHVEPYPDHRSAWKNGRLCGLEKVPTCVLSTNEGGRQAFDRYRLPIDKDVQFFWKDAPDDKLDSTLGAWVRKCAVS